LSVVLAPEAIADLNGALGFLARRSVPAARRLRSRVFNVIEALGEGTFEGPKSRLLTGEVVRSWPVSPLRIYYQRDGSTLHVLRVYHQARRPVTRQRGRVRR
jgi:plasmid stabilization system protein ParE